MGCYKTCSLEPEGTMKLVLDRNCVNFAEIMQNLSLFVVLVWASVVCGLPLDKSENSVEVRTQHNLQKRFINPMFSSGAAESDGGLVKIRTRRSEEECEKLQLCKLHARSNRNFLAAFQLYFVNKENARLWDHRPHSLANCEQRYGDCYYK